MTKNSAKGISKLRTGDLNVDYDCLIEKLIDDVSKNNKASSVDMPLAKPYAVNLETLHLIFCDALGVDLPDRSNEPNWRHFKELFNNGFIPRLRDAAKRSEWKFTLDYEQAGQQWWIVPIPRAQVLVSVIKLASKRLNSLAKQNEEMYQLAKEIESSLMTPELLALITANRALLTVVKQQTELLAKQINEELSVREQKQARLEHAND